VWQSARRSERRQPSLSPRRQKRRVNSIDHPAAGPLHALAQKDWRECEPIQKPSEIEQRGRCLDHRSPKAYADFRRELEKEIEGRKQPELQPFLCQPRSGRTHEYRKQLSPSDPK